MRYYWIIHHLRTFSTEQNRHWHQVARSRFAHLMTSLVPGQTKIAFYVNFEAGDRKIVSLPGPELKFENYESVQHRLQFSGMIRRPADYFITWYTVLKRPNKAETAVHGCNSWLLVGLVT